MLRVLYAQAGFNAGDGMTSTMLKYSRSSNITLLVNESNVNVPGLFAFRVDTADIAAGGCSESEPLAHAPVRGQQIGGTTVRLQGPCFDSNSTEILCRFGDFGIVRGFVQSEFRATCVSPLAAYPGSVDLAVSLDGGKTFISSGRFTYMLMNDDIFVSEEVIVRRNGIPEQAFSWNDTIELEWSFPATFLSGISSNTLIDIQCEILAPDEEGMRRRQRTSGSDVDIKIDSVMTLATDIRPQAGRQTIQINLAEIARKQQRIIPLLPAAIGVFRVGLFVRTAFKIYRNFRIAQKIVQIASKIGCDAWSDAQPNPITWNGGLPQCPNTMQQVSAATAGYDADDACKIGGSLPLLGNCWFHQGRPGLNEDSAAACFRSTASNIHGAGAQCCYNKAGQIITRGTGAGSDDRYHSGDTRWKHFFHDVLPFIACCKFQSDPETCDKYLKQRPSRPGSNTGGQFGGTWGDPHFLTLDGTSYTFNGYGEYTYLVSLRCICS